MSLCWLTYVVKAFLGQMGIRELLLRLGAARLLSPFLNYALVLNLVYPPWFIGNPIDEF